MSEPNKKYAAILFDLMDTLVHNPVLDGRVAEFFQEPFERLVRSLDPSSWVDFELGLLDEGEFAQRAFVDRSPIDMPRLRAWLRSNYSWIDGAEELVSELRAAGVDLHILSNYPVWYRLVEEALGCSRYVAWSFVSCETGVRKPDARSFIGVAEALGQRPDSLLLVDDLHDNCVAARAVGMDAIEFEDIGALREALRTRGCLR